MKAIEAIALTDALLPNAYDESIKLRWLGDLDGMILRDVCAWHEDVPGAQSLYSCDSELIAKPPYTGMYADYLAAMIHMHDAEYERYTNAMIRFNSAYAAFAADYNRGHKPLQDNKVHF